VHDCGAAAQLATPFTSTHVRALRPQLSMVSPGWPQLSACVTAFPTQMRAVFAVQTRTQRCWVHVPVSFALYAQPLPFIL
jgi:hypothetical protein